MNVLNSFALKNPCKRILWNIPTKICSFSIKNPASKDVLDIINKLQMPPLPIPDGALVDADGYLLVDADGYILVEQ